MRAYIAAFINDKKHFRNISKKTEAAYNSDLTQFAKFQEEHQLVLSDGILAFIDDLQYNRQLSDKTIKRKMTTCKMFYRYLLDEGVLKRDPNTGFHRSTKFITAKSLPRILSVGDVQDLLDTAYQAWSQAKTPYRCRTEIRNIAILELLISTGMRIGELSALTLSDLDLQNHSILIHGKNRKERMLFLSSTDTLHALNQYLHHRSDFLPKSDSLFVNKYGTTLSIFGIENVFYRYRNQSLILGTATPHYLRHTFATELINNGADIREVQELLGHSSITTTTIYANVSLEQKKRVLRQFNYRNALQIKTSK